MNPLLSPFLRLLASSPAAMGSIKYAGIGSRGTPLDILRMMQQVAQGQAARGISLRSGHAKGADYAFEQGAASVINPGRYGLTQDKLGLIAGPRKTSIDLSIPLTPQLQHQRNVWRSDWREANPPRYEIGVEGGGAGSYERVLPKLKRDPRVTSVGTQQLMQDRRPLAQLVQDVREELTEEIVGSQKIAVGPGGKNITWLKGGADPNVQSPNLTVIDLAETKTFKKMISSGNYDDNWANKGEFAGELAQELEGMFPAIKWRSTVKGGIAIPNKTRAMQPQHPPTSQLSEIRELAPPPAGGTEYGATVGKTFESTGPMEIFLPWKGYKGGGPQLGRPSQYATTGTDPIALAMIRGQLGPKFANPLLSKQFHSSIGRKPRIQTLEELGAGIPAVPPSPKEMLFARNLHQLMGRNLAQPDPVDFVMAYTPKGRIDPLFGGTSGTLRTARELDIPILNLGAPARAIESMSKPARVSDADWSSLIDFISRRLRDREKYGPSAPNLWDIAAGLT